MTNRRLLMVSIVLGFVVGLGAYLTASAVDRRSEASVSVILNENAVGWPFYAAAQERAAAFIDDPAEQAAINEQIGAEQRIELSVERPGDLSLLRVVGRADADASALLTAELGAERLVARSLEEQQTSIVNELDDLETLAQSADASVDDLQSSLAASEDDSDRIPIRADLEAVSRQAADARSRIAELELQLESTEAQFVIVGPAELEDGDRASIVGALAAGAGAAVLALLALSFMGSTDPRN